MGSEEDEEMMYYAGILLELPQLARLSEFREAWEQGNWNSSKKRSVRKIRRSFLDFNCLTSLMARFGSSECCVSHVPKIEKKGDITGMKRKKKNPNRIPSEVLLNVDGGDGITVGKKRKKRTEIPPPAAKKQKSFLKVTFKFTGRTTDSSIPGGSGSDVSTQELLSAFSNAIKYSDNVDQTEPSSSSVLVDNNVANPNSSTSAEKKKSNTIDDDKHMIKPLIPDLNIPAIMVEDALLDPTTSPLLLPVAVPMPPTHVQPQPPTLLQNNRNYGSYNFVRGDLVPAALLRLQDQRYNAFNDRAAAAKEKRMMRMMKLKQRKMTYCF